MVGNSRLHWGWFAQSTLLTAWDTPHLTDAAITTLMQQRFTPSPSWGADLGWHLPAVKPASPPLLWLASVVPKQTQRWVTYPPSHILTLDQMPLRGLYPTLGIDRALALWGAVQQVGSPVLVIDGGTALTLTAADENQRLMGGAILPGLRLQLRSLSQDTAGLPAVTFAVTAPLPDRWATDTPTAIQSGVIYTLLAGLRDFVNDWWERYPNGAVILTGGDGPLLAQQLRRHYRQQSHLLHESPHLVLLGISAARAATNLRAIS